MLVGGRYSFHIKENILIADDEGEYIYPNYIPNAQVYYFLWNKSSDVDTDEDLNINPEN